MQAAIEKEFDLLSDFEIREEARRRKEYYAYVDSLNKKIKEKDEIISNLQAELNKYKSAEK